MALSALAVGATPNWFRACSIISAAVPVTTPAAMLDPLRYM